MNGYLFFWGGWPSNWEPSIFVLNGIKYNCVEQYMMAEKARLFSDHDVVEKIMASPYPKAQKGFGRKVRGYDDVQWAKVRYQVVLDGTLAKYRQNEHLYDLLMATNEIFVEASPEDIIWGIGMRQSDHGIENPANWKGQNLLGMAITEARNILLEENLT